MFQNEIAINQVLIRQFSKTLKDIPEDELFHPVPGHGHPPIWILGHLAIVAELGQLKLNGKLTHPDWVSLFGMGSSDIISPDEMLTKENMKVSVVGGYARLREMAATADQSLLNNPHGIEIFHETSIETIGHCVSLILTSHFGFHLAQLSSCRRAAGYGPLF